jgi:hypothetical protein
MSDLGFASEPLHSATRCLAASVTAPSDGWSTLAWMEKIMSKTNDTSKLDRPKLENRVLADSELDAVSGGAEAKDTVATAVVAALVHILPHGI